MDKRRIPYNSMANQCPTCGEMFSSVYAFDKHRTGTFHPPARRCLSTDEMLSLGMAKNQRGLWVSSLNKLKRSNG
jgi:hypothetical protein